MQTTNRQETVAFTFTAAVDNDVLGVVDPSQATGFPLNGGTALTIVVDMTKTALALTFRLYVQAVFGGGWGLAGSYILAPGSVQVVGGAPITMNGYAVRLVCNPGAGNTPDVDVSATVSGP